MIEGYEEECVVNLSGVEICMYRSRVQPGAMGITIATDTEPKMHDVILQFRAQWKSSSFTNPVQAPDGMWLASGRVWDQIVH